MVRGHMSVGIVKDALMAPGRAQAAEAVEVALWGGRHSVKASVFVGTSVDGFIARVNGDFDFLDHGGGEAHGYEEFMATVDALVMGRNTFDTVLGFEAWPYGEKPVFVLSTRELPPLPQGAVAERMSGEPAEHTGPARGARHQTCLRRRRDHDPAVPAGRAHPDPHHHARSRAHRRRDPPVWRAPAGHRPSARGDAAVRAAASSRANTSSRPDRRVVVWDGARMCHKVRVAIGGWRQDRDHTVGDRDGGEE